MTERQAYAITPWGWARGRWSHYRVTRPVGQADEMLCQHEFRHAAEVCIQHRTAGAAQCVDTGQRPEPGVRPLLDRLSRLTDDALNRAHAPAALWAVAEELREVVDGIRRFNKEKSVRTITMTLAEYLEAGRMRHLVCFACRRVAEPMPPRPAEPSGTNERACGLCCAAAALPLEQAVRERWLIVTGAEGRALNDATQVDGVLCSGQGSLA